jgi:membrane protein DedA with SNARE-associated domain
MSKWPILMLMMVPTGYLFDLLRRYFQHYGYWTVAVALLLENMGLPVPGETTLLFASFLAYSQHELQLPVLIAFGVAAAVIGDNAGFAFGHFAGRPLVDRYLHVLHVSRRTIEKGERFFAQRGPLAIFLARFLAGVRIVAGPLAGTLHMPWKKFLLFNFLGAVSWVLTISLIGYFFGGQLQRLIRTMGRADLVILAGVVAGALLWWRWKRHHSGDADEEEKRS